ncbi:MAG: hypothetical protein EZS28_009400, partial [Streblomastix strix]
DTYEGGWRDGIISGPGIYQFAEGSIWNNPEL